MTSKEKAAAGFGTRAAAILKRVRNSIGMRVWVLAYSLEEKRQRYADRRQLLRQAATCVALSLVRLVGVRYA